MKGEIQEIRYAYQKVAIIGAGNVGYHLAKRLYDCGHTITQVFSRGLEKADILAREVDAQAIHQLDKIKNNADIYLVAVKDEGIKPVAELLSTRLSGHKIIAHTSGATPSTVFAAQFKHFGIFYPLQTFSRQHKADFQTIPFCIDANGKETLGLLLNLAKSIAPNVYTINDQERKKLHVAAVFVNNFTNYLLSIGEDLLEKEGLSFDILKPLALETVRKLQHNKAKEVQTGPAIRGDEATIQAHLDYLNKFPKHQFIYKLLTERIREWK